MKQFHYKAYDEEGGIHEGSLAARTKREAAAALFSEGLSVIRLFEEKEAHRFFPARPFASRRALSLLASSWAALLSAGLTVTESLSLLASKERPQERRLLLSARERIASGHSLSDSFAAGGWCPSFFISLLEVGEMTGTLPSALTHIALYYEKEDLFRRRLPLRCFSRRWGSRCRWRPKRGWRWGFSFGIGGCFLALYSSLS